MAIQRDIELRPHEAVDREGNPIVFAQDQIFLNGMRVGYVGHTPGEQIAFIRPVDAATKQAIKDFVAEARGGVQPAGSVTATPIQEALVSAGLADEDDD